MMGSMRTGIVGGVQAVSGCAGKRDDPIVAIGTAIVNPHDDHPSVGKVSDPRVARDRQRRVRCGQLSRIEGFAAGGQVAVGFCVIDRRETGLSKVGRILNDFVAFTVALIILIRRGVWRFILRIGAADLNRRAITDGRLWSTDRFCCTSSLEHAASSPAAMQIPSHCLRIANPFKRFSTTFFCGYGSTLRYQTRPSVRSGRSPVAHQRQRYAHHR